ncbi:serine hydrolase [Longispora sp. K20-0274]|uniref:serine hydrolase n=1 Tax=Longispora sp. K20-0274 TaxID=3088255 RepID=UPI00399AB314
MGRRGRWLAMAVAVLVAGAGLWAVRGPASASTPAAKEVPAASGTTSPTPAQASTKAPTEAPPETPQPVAPAPAPPDLVTPALDAALAGFEGTLSLAVVDHVRGTTTLYHADDTFRTASIVKVAILAELLDREPELSDDDRALAYQMITVSDNDAATDLWDAIDGATGLTDLVDRLGLAHTVPGEDGAWGVTTTTAADQVRLLDAVTGPGLLATLMSEVTADQRWGVTAAARPGESVLVKNGWMNWDDVDGTWSVNSIGRITGPGVDVTIAVLSTGATTEERGIAAVEAVAVAARAAGGW